METVFLVVGAMIVLPFLFSVVMGLGMGAVSLVMPKQQENVTDDMDIRASYEEDMALARRSILMHYTGEPLDNDELNTIAAELVARGNESLRQQGYKV